jgi:hypothetical protein
VIAKTALARVSCLNYESGERVSLGEEVTTCLLKGTAWSTDWSTVDITTLGGPLLVYCVRASLPEWTDSDRACVVRHNRFGLLLML